MGISVLGPLTIEDPAARLSPRETVILAALAARAGVVLGADQLADVVWGDSPPRSWHKNLQSCIVRLRKVLGPESIETSPQGYRLNLPDDEVDSRQFEGLVVRGRELLTLGEPERAAYTLSQALALWRGRPFGELEEWEPGALEAARLSELRLDAQEWWLDAALQSGHHREVLSQARGMASAAPLRERLWELLALAQYRAGRQGEALQTIAQVRRRLVDELGLDPGTGLDTLEAAILRQDPALDVDSARAQASDVCPYPGLMPYDVVDDEVFFGRDRDIAACRERLAREGVLAVLGPSGSGKSSLVRAGVVAALRREGQHCDVITPGARPVSSLPPPRPARRPRVLVVDQAEEMFTLCHDLEERELFAGILADHAEAAPLVLVLRADRMGELSGHPALARLVERGLYVLAAMPPEELHQAIEGPARQFGLIVEPGLADLLAHEVGGEAGALPLLSHTLRETWLRREGRTLTVAGYQSTGGIRGAVAQSAEGVYSSLEADQQRALRDLLLRLVSPGAEGEPVRSRVPRRQVGSDPRLDELVDLLVGSRLVTSDDGVIELAHEALARAWPRLKNWLEEDVEGQRILHHLTVTADTWETLGRPESELYRGVRLARALEWQARPHPELTLAEHDFLDASEALAEAEERSATAQAHQQRRMIRRLRLVLAGSLALLVAALAAGGVAVRQQRVAADAADAAVSAQTAADARRVGARALAVASIDDSLLLAVAGVRLDDSEATRANLQAAIARRPQLIRSVPTSGSVAVTGLDLSPDGRRLAVYSLDGRVEVYDVRTWEQVAPAFTPPRSVLGQERVGPVAFSPDGRSLAVGMPILAEEPLRLLDAESLTPLPVELPGLDPRGPDQSDRTLDVAWSEDGTLAATFHRLKLVNAPESPWWKAARSRLVAWDLSDPAAPAKVADKELKGRTIIIRDRPMLALSPDGGTAWTSMRLAGHDLATTGRTRFQTSIPGYALDVSPDGRTLAVDSGVDVALLDARTGERRRNLRGHTERVNALRFSDDGALLASTSADGTAIVWDVADGKLRETLALGANEVHGLAFSADGAALYTAGADRTIRMWDLSGGQRFVTEIRAPGEFGIGWALPSPGGTYTVHNYIHGGVRFFDSSTGAATDFMGPPGGIYGGNFSSDSSRFVGVLQRRMWVWDPATGELLADNRDHRAESSLAGAAYTDDGSRIVGTDETGSLHLFDGETLAPIDRPVRLGTWICCANTGEDDRIAVAVVGSRGTENNSWPEFEYGGGEWVRVDLETGRVLTRGRPGFLMWDAQLSPDGRRVAVVGGAGQVGLMDALTGRSTRPAVIGHDDRVNYVFWAPDGSAYVTTAGDGTVALWDGRTGGPLGSVVLPERSISAARFAPDNTTVVIGTYTDALYEWDTSTAHAVDFACALVGRDFTEAEWSRWFGDRPYQPTCLGS